MIHVHVRDANGTHILNADAYRDVPREIRRDAGADVIVEIRPKPWDATRRDSRWTWSTRCVPKLFPLASAN